MSSDRGPKKTRRMVLLADRIAERAITVGGIMVIGAVLGMLVFLVFEVLPLFKGGEVVSHVSYAGDPSMNNLISASIDDYKTVAALLDTAGKVTLTHVRTGTSLKGAAFDFKDKKLTSFSKTLDNSNVAFGFDDGTVSFGKIQFRAEILTPEQVPSGLSKIDEFDGTDGTAIYSVIPGKQVRKISLDLTMEDEIKISEAGKPIVVMDYRLTQFGERPKRTLAMADSSGAVTLNIAESRLNLFTRKSTTKLSNTTLPPLEKDSQVSYALVNDTGEEVYFANKAGKIYRYNVRNFASPQLAEVLTLLPPGVELTAFGFLLGERSIVVGGSDGSTVIYFLLADEKAQTADGFRLIKTRVLESHKAAVTGFSPSQRGKTFATSDAAGNVWIRNGTSRETLLKLKSSAEVPGTVTPILAPRLNGLMAMSRAKTDFWNLDIPHPEVSLGTLFGKVWYEGYPEPTYTWQSTGATDEFEPKLSLVPLIFGTIKATFYSLLFAIPIALLAAIYTSEFLAFQVRAMVKPVMEIMASIPSVVLGFIAALVLSPIVENWISAIIFSFVIIPLCIIISAFLWQLLPSNFSLRLQGIPKFLIMFLVVGGSIYAAYAMGPLFEKIFFYGNFRTWLNGGIGKAWPFLFLLLLPVAGLTALFGFSYFYGPSFKAYLRQIPMPYSALLDFGRWLGMAALSCIVSYVAARALGGLGIDPRESFVGTYVQRNTLIVGFAMGFAVIPIIYTLAEDALNSVPEHLRSASLGCGATPWQTAMWIILPTAISGVFSAVMIGMGRAVGETMIVVMSAGNTPIIDWNIFNGLRALSANIAVELPEAPKDGSLYRVLFFTGLVLFCMTFVINTVAELVRLRFRKRAMQL